MTGTDPLSEFDRLPNDALLTERQVAAILNCSVAKLQADRWSGIGIPFCRVGRLVRYRKADVLAAIHRGRVPTRTEEVPA